VPLNQSDWNALAKGLGQTHVRHADGSPVVYATRVQVISEDPRPDDPAKVAVIFRDELGQEVGRVRGDQVTDLAAGGPSSVLVVTDDVEADDTPTVVTRGASPGAAQAEDNAAKGDADGQDAPATDGE
jgi:hypothetical protein